MHLERIVPRDNWREKVIKSGCDWLVVSDGSDCWTEDRMWAFTENDISKLELAADEMQRLIHLAVERAMGDEKILDLCRIPDHMRPYLRKTWATQNPSLHMRMDFRFDGASEPVLYETNADNPAGQFETHIMQMDWFREHGRALTAGRDARILADLETAYATLFATQPIRGTEILFVFDQGDTGRRADTQVIIEAARRAGYGIRTCWTEELRVTQAGAAGLHGAPVRTIFKNKQWWILMAQDIGQALSQDHVQVYEPYWKILVQNKCLLPLLWELAPGHPNLLETYFEGDPRIEGMREGGFVRKPIYGREGKGIEITQPDGSRVVTEGSFDDQTAIIQAYAPLPDFAGRKPLIGLWHIGGKTAGLLIRDDASLITRWESVMSPHVIIG